MTLEAHVTSVVSAAFYHIKNIGSIRNHLTQEAAVTLVHAHVKFDCPFAKFRCGVAPIRLETGRYENLPEEQRLCPMCDSQAIESEIHMLTKCNLYINLRADLFHKTSSVNNNFNNFTDTQTFIFLMTNG